MASPKTIMMGCFLPNFRLVRHVWPPRPRLAQDGLGSVVVTKKAILCAMVIRISEVHRRPGAFDKVRTGESARRGRAGEEASGGGPRSSLIVGTIHQRKKMRR